MTRIDTNIQIGDIRVCDIEYKEIMQGDLVEIIGQGKYPNFWQLRIIRTEELWDIRLDGKGNALNQKHLQELVSRANDQYEVCE